MDANRFAPKDANVDMPKTTQAKEVSFLSVRNPYPHGYAEPFIRVAVDGKHFDVARSKEGDLYHVLAKAFEALYTG